MLSYLSTVSHAFGVYIEWEWVTKKEPWAYCNRAGMDINTNMLVEAFHEVFKYNYLKKRKFNKWVHDTCM